MGLEDRRERDFAWRALCAAYIHVRGVPDIRVYTYTAFSSLEVDDRGCFHSDQMDIK